MFLYLFRSHFANLVFELLLLDLNGNLPFAFLLPFLLGFLFLLFTNLVFFTVRAAFT